MKMYMCYFLHCKMYNCYFFFCFTCFSLTYFTFIYINANYNNQIMRTEYPTEMKRMTLEREVYKLSLNAGSAPHDLCPV